MKKYTIKIKKNGSISGKAVPKKKRTIKIKKKAVRIKKKKAPSYRRTKGAKLV